MDQNWSDFDENEAPGMFLKTLRSGIGFGPPGPQNYTVLDPPPKKVEKNSGGWGVQTQTHASGTGLAAPGLQNYTVLDDFFF